MKGATAELPPKTIIIPNNKRITIIGKSHHFFLSLKKFHKSLIVSISILISRNYMNNLNFYFRSIRVGFFYQK